MSSELSRHIANRIVAARKKKGLTQYQVAERIGITPGRYLHYEKGRAEPGLDIIYKLCKLFGESFDEWLGLRRPPDELGFSEQEVRFMILYRKLDEEGRQAVNGMVRALLSAAHVPMDFTLEDSSRARMGTAPGSYGVVYSGYAAYGGDGWKSVMVDQPVPKEQVDEAFAQARAVKADREADEAAREAAYNRRRARGKGADEPEGGDRGKK